MLLQGKKGSKPLSHYYVDFKMAFEEVRVLFSISTDLRKMQTQWKQLGVLMFLGGLPSDFTLTWPQVIASSALNSLSETYQLLHNIFPDAPTN